MKHSRHGAKTSSALISSRLGRGHVVAIVALVVSGCSGSKASQEVATPNSPAPESHESQYMQLCTRDYAVGGDKRAQKIGCECAFYAAHKRLNDIEMEMLIAKRSQNKQRQTEIRARQDYSEASYQKNMKGSAEDAFKCAMEKSSQ